MAKKTLTPPPLLARLAELGSRVLLYAALPVALLLVLVMLLWSIGCLYFDHARWMAYLWPCLLLVALLLMLRKKYSCWRIFAVLGLAVTTLFGVLLGLFFNAKPPQNRQWEPEYAKTSYAKIEGDNITVYNVRDFVWQNEHQAQPRWQTRQYKFSQLEAVDFYCVYWAGPMICHTMVSFVFKDAEPLCFSIEAARGKQQPYSALGGLYRQYPLHYVVGSESDLVQLRSSHRQGEEVHMLRLQIAPIKAKAFLYYYLEAINDLQRQPRWYNAVSSNCTTNIVTQVQHVNGQQPFDWRLLANGYLPYRMHERGSIRNDLSVAELMELTNLGKFVPKNQNREDFSKFIREQIAKRLAAAKKTAAPSPASASTARP